MNRHSPDGFSLLELMLALALSTLVLALVGMAIYSHLTQLTTSRNEVEEAQLARGILSTIAADLRAATAGVEQDMAPLLGLATEQSQFDVDTVDQSAADTNAADSGSTDTSSASDSATPAAVDPVKVFVGLTGGANAIEFDTTRPAMELAAVTADAASTAPPVARFASSLTRVRYAVGATGLARQQTPVAAARWRVEQGLVPAFNATDGGSQMTEETTVPWAAEVRAIAFRYTDGEQIYPVWDPAERGALPRAVEVTIEIASATSGSDGTASNATASDQTAQQGRVYRQWVAIPASRELSEEGAAADDPISAASAGEAT